MKFAETGKYFTFHFEICLIALALFLSGCSKDIEVSPSDPVTAPTFISAESQPDTPSPVDPIPNPEHDSEQALGQDFERDPYTTEFAIDRTLAQAVRKNQGLPDDMPLTKEFAAAITELLLFDGVRIETLNGISNFTSLERLSVSETDCQDIEELTQMQSLTYIDISWGYIAKIPDFSDCPNLTELHLAANLIADVAPLCNATSLRFVDLSHNDITSVAPLKDVTFLDALCLDANCITDYAAIKDNQTLRRALDAASQSSFEYAIQTEERAKNIVSELTDDSMTAENKLAKLYAYIIDNVTYDESSRSSRPFGYWALFDGKGVCGDYAEGLCLLARHAGLVCKVVSSDTHAFNAVELDGKWYLFDSLWDDIAEGAPTDYSTWNYFGFTTEAAFAMPHHFYDAKRCPVSEQWLKKITYH